jgi:hypothetical protein
MRGTALIRVVSVLLAGSCPILCQVSGTPREHPDTLRPTISLPDTPSAKDWYSPLRSSLLRSAPDAARADIFRVLQDAARSPVTATTPADVPYASLWKVESRQSDRPEDFNKFLDRYLSPAAVKGSHSFHPATDGSLMHRATYAASSTLIKRDDSGKKRLNTSYLLSVLTSTVADTASRPYWRRSASQPFSDLGSTIGNDAGMNVFHQFEPALRALAKNHEPRFIAGIESKIAAKLAGGMTRR